MATTVSRKGALPTMTDAFEWLKRNPLLFVLFFALGVVQALGEELFLFSLLGYLLMLYLGGISHLFARDELEGTTPDFSKASSQVLGRMVSLVVIFVVYFVAVVIGFILLIVPGIYLALRLSLAFPACVIDDEGAFDSLSTSWDVAQGNLLKLLGITILSIIVTLAAIFVGFVLGIIGLGVLPAIVLVTAVVTAALQPVIEMSYARVYLENRETGDASAVTDDRPDDAWTGDDAAGV